MHTHSHILMVTLASVFLLISCQSQTPPASPSLVAIDPTLAAVPDWSKEAVWYQIFVERFRNGDPSNDPRPQDMQKALNERIPENWAVTPWEQEWYKDDPWFEQVDNRGLAMQMRRYGGDLQGVIDQLDYLSKLGVTAIYFNPLNDAPSLHKFDARNYRHIDRNFGPKPQEDMEIMASEVPHDPETWKWTHADQLFLDLIQQCHERGIRIIVDYSWNHTGREFWALEDIRKNGEASRFKDWYTILSYDDPTTETDEFDYEGWFGLKSLPVLKEDVVGEEHKAGEAMTPLEGNMHSESLKQHIFNVSKRWLDPNGDGDPSDGIDGFRLDVAAEVTMGFWREYRAFVRSINPEAYLVGEIWWELWPNDLMDPTPYLQGDMFDAVMNYRWYRMARGFFAQGGPVLSASDFVTGLKSLQIGFSHNNTLGMMNVAASHDSPRLGTSLHNKNLYKHHSSPGGENEDYWIAKPSERTIQEQKLFLLHQFTYLGAPHIWNGDEAGMWGSDDPNCRKPLVWADLEYEDETLHPNPEKSRPRDKVEVNQELLAYYQRLGELRGSYPSLRTGEIEFIHIGDDSRTLGYRRTLGEEEIVVLFNASDNPRKIEFEGNAVQVYTPVWGGETIISEGGKFSVSLESLSGVVLVGGASVNFFKYTGDIPSMLLNISLSPLLAEKSGEKD